MNSPGIASGRVTRTKRQAPFAPSVPAAASSRVSMLSNDSRMARTIRGKPMTAQARAAPVQRNDSTMPMLAKASPNTPRRPKTSSST